MLKERGQGDSFFTVFHRPSDALTAALAAQVAVMSERWADNIPIAVRIAILTGEADAQDRDYRAPAVNRCAKLRRRAVGNQILVSETTYSIVADTTSCVETCACSASASAAWKGTIDRRRSTCFSMPRWRSSPQSRPTISKAEAVPALVGRSWKQSVPGSVKGRA